uniref:KRAB-related domain-containing protein n=1 Tax=Theropithecus gelada TaxID=9565 RepID=A0A8D2EGK6_THEGE
LETTASLQRDPRMMLRYQRRDTNKAFNDTARYLSKKEWEKLKNSEKITYVYMKRNYETMTKLERPQMAFGMLHGNFPKMMPKKPAEEGNDLKGVPEASGSRKKGEYVWIHRLQERKYLMIYKEISDPEEDDE